MERGKKSTKALTEEEKWMVTANHIGKVITECSNLCDYADCWSNFSNDPDCIRNIQGDIKQSIRAWIKSTPDHEIVRLAKKLNPIACQHLVRIMPIQFRGFFEYRKGQFPIELSAPIPFFSYEKKLGTIHLSAPIILQQGETTIKIRNVICRSDDIKTYVALNQIRKQIKCQKDSNSRCIIISTSFKQIAKELGKTNPGHERVHEGIRTSLERLRDMSLTWERGQGKDKKWYDGSLLHLSTNLDEDSWGDVEIHMDLFFLEWMHKQFNGIENTQGFNTLSGKQINLYLFLNRQPAFNTYGLFNSEQYHQNIPYIYKMAGMSCPLNKQPSLSQIKRDMNKQLNGLKGQNMIVDYAMIDNFIQVSRNKALPERTIVSKKAIVKEKEVKQPKYICPHGHQFGVDSYNYPECKSGNCKLWEECDENSY